MKEYTSLFSKILDILVNPTNTVILASLTFASFSIFSLNFLPETIIERINLMNFLEKYSFISIIAFITLGTLLIGQLIFMLLEKNKGKKQRKKQQEHLKKVHEELFQDYDAQYYLLLLYINHPNAVELPLLNQKVNILFQYGLITQVTKQWMVDQFDPRYPFVLQPFAEQRIKEDIEKGAINLDDFKDFKKTYTNQK